MRIEHHLEAYDLPAIARLHRESFPDFFLSRLGEPFLVKFYRGFIADPSAVVAVSRTDAGPNGLVVGTTEPAGFFSRLLRHQFVGFASSATAFAFRNPRAAGRLLAALSYRGDSQDGLDAGALLSSICVDPQFQGQGVGAALIRAWRERAAAMGASAAHLSTDAVGNGAVNAFYRRDGWALASTYLTRQDRSMNLYTIDLPQSLERDERLEHSG